MRSVWLTQWRGGGAVERTGLENRQSGFAGYAKVAAQTLLLPAKCGDWWASWDSAVAWSHAPRLLTFLVGRRVPNPRNRGGPLPLEVFVHQASIDTHAAVHRCFQRFNPTRQRSRPVDAADVVAVRSSLYPSLRGELDGSRRAVLGWDADVGLVRVVVQPVLAAAGWALESLDAARAVARRVSRVACAALVTMADNERLVRIVKERR